MVDDVDEFAARFLACSIPGPEFTHQAHLAVGLWHVRRYGRDEALTRLRVGICRLNESHGTPNTATRGYHETITRAYVQLLTEFVDRFPSESVNQQVARLLASPVARKDVLLTFYSRERLMSPDARAEWVEPDISPLTLDALD